MIQMMLVVGSICFSGCVYGDQHTVVVDRSVDDFFATVCRFRSVDMMKKTIKQWLVDHALCSSFDLDRWVDQDGNTLLMRAVKADNHLLAHWILDHACTVFRSRYNRMAWLFFAPSMVINIGDINAVNNKGHNVLMVAVKKGCSEKGEQYYRLIKRLVGYGAYSDQAVWYAAKKGKVTICSVLKKDCAAQDSLGNNALMYAVKAGSYDLVNLLIKEGFDINYKNSTGQTPLMWAVDNGDAGMVRLLLSKKRWGYRSIIDLNAQDEMGETALHKASAKMASMYDQLLPIVALLCASGIDANLCNNDGATALMKAAALGRLSMVDVLVKHAKKIEVNGKDAHGNTALMMAVNGGHHAVVGLLLSLSTWSGSHHVSIDEQNNSGQSALMIAAQRNDHKMVTWLLDAGANVYTIKDNGHRNGWYYMVHHLTHKGRHLLDSVVHDQRINRCKHEIAARLHYIKNRMPHVPNIKKLFAYVSKRNSQQ